MFHTLLGPSGSLLVAHQGLTALVCHSVFFLFLFLSRMGVASYQGFSVGEEPGYEASKILVYNVA